MYQLFLHFVYKPQVSTPEVSFLWDFAGSVFCSSPTFRIDSLTFYFVKGILFLRVNLDDF